MPAAAVASRPYAAVLSRIDTLYVHGRTATADSLLDSLLVASERTSDGAGRAAALARRSAVHVYFRRWDQANADAEQAIEWARTHRDTLTWAQALLSRGRSALFRDQLREAEPFYRTLARIAPATRSPRLVGNAQLGMAYLDLQAGKRERAARGYRQAIRALERAKDTGSELTARVGLARTLRTTGQLEDAKSEYLSVISRAQAVGDLRDEADAWNNLALIERETGDPERAGLYLERALECNRRLKRPVDAQIQNLALLLLYRNDVEGATALLERELGAISGAPRTASEAALRSLLGTCYTNAARYQEALRILTTVWAVRDSFPPITAGDAGYHLGRALLKARQPERALGVIDTVRARYMASLDQDRVNSLQTIEIDALLALGSGPRARLLARSEYRNTPNGQSIESNLSAAIRVARCEAACGEQDSVRALLPAIGERITALRGRVRGAEWNSAAGAQWTALPTLAIGCELGSSESARGAPAARAFDVLQVLRPAERAHARTPLANARRLAGALQQGEVFVDLYWDGTDSTLSGILVPARGEPLAWQTTSIPHAELLRAVGPLIAESSPETVDALARGILTRCFGPALEPILRSRRVWICPPAWLSAVPYEALLARSGSGAAPEVISAYSASALVAMRSNRAPVLSLGHIVVVARATALNGRELPGVRAEADWLRSRFGAQGPVHRGERDWKQLRPWLTRGDVLHLAGHSRSNHYDAWGSGLLLGPGDHEDAWLTLRQVAQQPRVAPLVVLSTCSASVGSSLGNEPVQGIATGFVLAGARSVITTLWDVDDRTATQFTRHFYPALARGLTVGQALRETRQSLARSAPGQTPASWAGFVLVGDPDLRVLPPTGVR